MLKLIKRNYDAIIIGAGPIGGLIADIISKKNYDVLLVEEHYEIGKPVQCAGLITPRVFDLVDCRKHILNDVRGAQIFSPKGHTLSIDGGEGKAVVIDRASFDKEIVKSALKNGAELSLGAKAVKAERKNERVILTLYLNGRKMEAASKILIGADGIQSNVRRWFNLPKPRKILSGFQAEMVNIDIDLNFVKIFIGNEVAPQFFAWIIPMEEGKARVGLCSYGTKESPYFYFKRLFKNDVSKQFLKEAQPINYTVGAIPIGMVSRTYDDNIMIVGDAAAQVKATSGGGIYTGLVCAKHCGEVAVISLESNDFSKNFLSNYQKRCMKEIGKELKADMRIHEVFAGLSDRQFEEIIDILDDEKLLKIISEVGDMDYPSKVGWALLKKEPRLLKFLGAALKTLF